MREEARRHKAPEPTFAANGFFTVTFWPAKEGFLRPTDQVTAQVTAQVEAVLSAAAQGAKSREELQAAASMRHREHFRKAYLQPLLASGWLERTIRRMDEFLVQLGYLKGEPTVEEWGMKDKQKLAFAILAVAVSVAVFLTILSAELPAIAKFVLAVLALAACGAALAYAYKLEIWAGMFLLRSQSGLAFLDRLAKKHHHAWQIFSEIGMVIGYGSFAYFLLQKRRLAWKRVALTYGLGAVFLVLLTSLLAPLAIFLNCRD